MVSFNEKNISLFHGQCAIDQMIVLVDNKHIADLNTTLLRSVMKIRLCTKISVITDWLLWAPIVMKIWWLSSGLSTFVRFWTGYHCWRFPVTEHQTDGGEKQRLPVSPGNISGFGTLSRLLSPSRPRTLHWQQAAHKTSACYVMALYYGGIVTWCAWISPLA